MKTFYLLMMLGIMSLGLVSAGLLDWFIKPKEEIYKPAFNITDDFTTSKNTLTTKDLCDSSISKLTTASFTERYEKPLECKEYETTDKISKETIYSDKDITLFPYFKLNTDGITRFNNE